MKSGSRDEPGTRLHAEQQFREGEIQILVATEAAGEGINLQVCNILFNYDIPWNPNRLEQRMGRIHRYGQRKDCLIFNFVATNTIEGRVLQRLLEKLQEIRDALDDDAVFNVVGEVLPAAHVERVLRDYYAGRLGDADLEERLLRDVDESAVPRHLPERPGGAREQEAQPRDADRAARAGAGAARRAGDHRALPARGGRVRAAHAQARAERAARLRAGAHALGPPPLREGPGLEAPGSRGPLSALLHRPRHGRDGEAGVGHARPSAVRGDPPAHPRAGAGRPRQGRDLPLAPARAPGAHRLLPGARRGRTRAGGPRAALRRRDRRGWRASAPGARPARQLRARGPAGRDARRSRPSPRRRAWLHEHALAPFLEETRKERLTEVERVSAHVELSLTELLQRADEEIGRAASDVEQKLPGAEGRLAQAETRHAELLARRERRRIDLERQRALTLQAVERLASVLVLPHPEREAPEVRRLKPNFETEATAMRVVMEHEQAQGRQVYDVSEKNLGYDITSLDLASGELRLIEVKGLGAATGTILLTPNERRVAEDRPRLLSGSTSSPTATRSPACRSRSATRRASTGTR